MSDDDRRSSVDDAEESPSPGDQAAFEDRVADFKRSLPGATDAEARRLASSRTNAQLEQLWYAIRRRTAPPQAVRRMVRTLPTAHLGSLEELRAAKDRRVKEIDELHCKVAFGVILHFSPAPAGQEQYHPDYLATAQCILEETAQYLDLGCIQQELDQRSMLPAPKLWLQDRRTPRPLRQWPESQRVLSGLCGEHFDRERAIHAEGEDWTGLTQMERVCALNGLVLDMLESAPESASRVPFYDLTPAAHGDAAAWERLRAACLKGAEDERAPSPRLVKRPKDLQRWRIIWRQVKPGWDRGKSYTWLAEWVSKDENLKVSPDILAEVIRAGEEGLLDR